MFFVYCMTWMREYTNNTVSDITEVAIPAVAAFATITAFPIAMMMMMMMMMMMIGREKAMMPKRVRIMI